MHFDRVAPSIHILKELSWFYSSEGGRIVKQSSGFEVEYVLISSIEDIPVT
jgi:hypothetical protein